LAFHYRRRRGYWSYGIVQVLKLPLPLLIAREDAIGVLLRIGRARYGKTACVMLGQLQLDLPV